MYQCCLWVSAVQSFALSIVLCFKSRCILYLWHIHAHCTALYTPHTLHTRYSLLPHHYTPSGVAHNSLAGGSMSTQQMLYILQKPTNSTKLDSASSVFKGCTLPLSAALQHISCQGVALYFNYTLPRLFVLYSLHFMYTIVLCTFHAYVPIHVHIGTGRGGVVPSGRNHCVTTFDLPKAGSGAPPICRPTPQL